MSDVGLQRRTICLLGGLAAFGPISTDLYLPALPQTAASLHTSAVAVQLTLTASVLGLGAGQLLVGPLSDHMGRRRPLLAGLALFVAFSIGCAVAPNVGVLGALRLGQALGASAGLVLSRAIVRDSVDGERLRAVFSVLVVVSGLAPILAPIAGSQLIRVASWRVDFLVLAGLGVVLLCASYWSIQETLPATRRSTARRQAFVAYGVLLRSPRFTGLIVVFAACFGVLFAYIASSPFALQVLHGFSPGWFGVLFAANASTIMICSRIRLSSAGRNIVLALGVMCAGVSLVGLSASFGDLATLLAGFALVCCSFGLLAPSATAEILAGQGERAGAASAVQGASQFVTAGVVGALVGLRGQRDLHPLALVMAGLAAIALTSYVVAGRRPGPSLGAQSCTTCGAPARGGGTNPLCDVHADGRQ